MLSCSRRREHNSLPVDDEPMYCRIDSQAEGRHCSQPCAPQRSWEPPQPQPRTTGGTSRLAASQVPTQGGCCVILPILPEPVELGKAKSRMWDFGWSLQLVVGALEYQASA